MGDISAAGTCRLFQVGRGLNEFELNGFAEASGEEEEEGPGGRLA